MAAHALARSEVARRALRASFELAESDGLDTTLCYLLAGDDPLAVGMGKGRGIRGETGALFEAVERLVMGEQPDRDLPSRPVEELVRQSALGHRDTVHRVATTHPQAMCVVGTYTGPRGTIDYPVGLLNPFVAEMEVAAGAEWASDYLRYSSSVGTAAGSDCDEATLHALLEMVEHDAVSLALLGWFALGTEPARVVERSSAPPEVESLGRMIEDRTQRSLMLVDVTSDLGLPCFVAVLDGAVDAAGIVGAGASTSATDAAVGALSEVVQLWACHGQVVDAVRQPSPLARWPALERSHRLSHEDLGPLAVSIDWGQHPEPDAHDVRSGLELVDAALLEHGLDRFACVLAEPTEGVVVVSCVVPGLERFSIVRHGHPVVPTGRGRALWEQALAGVNPLDRPSTRPRWERRAR